jgi:hypothetical protein
MTPPGATAPTPRSKKWPQFGIASAEMPTNAQG